jgi:predicted NBD/HSP70 family sugar kinase
MVHMETSEADVGHADATTSNSVYIGIDNGGNANNVTVLDREGRYLIERMLEVPSRVLEGPEVAVTAMVEALHLGLEQSQRSVSAVRAVGLDTPGPASALGVLSSRGSTNFSTAAWRGFDIRTALEAALGLPVVYSNDGNAAALYAHHAHFGALAAERSSVSAIVGTGLGGGVIEGGRIIAGASGMGGELGHVHIPMAGLLEPGQPIPTCNCGFTGDVESVASLTGIEKNLLPFWLSRYPDHELATVDLRTAAKRVRGLAERRDPLAIAIFEQQAKALGHLFTLAANFIDPDAFFIGGGVVEAAPEFRDWFLDTVRSHTTLRLEQSRTTEFALVPDLDMAGARGSALAAMSQFR